jgi:hypothetical protein
MELGEDARPPRAVKQRVDVLKRLHCRARDGVEAPVVVRPVRLARKHHRSTWGPADSREGGPARGSQANADEAAGLAGVDPEPDGNSLTF